MANIITYNQVVELLTDIARRHYQVNTFYLGRNWELENSDDILYPLFQVYPDFGRLPINAFNEYKTQQIRFVCKVIDTTTPGEDNERDVHSDTLRIAQDIVNEFNQHPFYVRSNIKLIEDIDFTPLEEFKDDISAGWQFNLVFQIINLNTFCGMPIAEIPGFSATGPTSQGEIVNVKYLTCDTLTECPTIITIDETLTDLQEQIDNIPPSALTLEQVLGYGNSTGGTDIVVNQADTISFLGNTNASIYKYTYNESFGPSQYSDLRVDGNTVYSDKVQVGMPPYWSFFRLPSYNSLGVNSGISIIANASIGSNTITFHSVDSGSGLNPIISEISVNSVTGVMTYNNQLNIATKLLVDTIEPYSSGRVFVGSTAYGAQLKGTIDVTSLTGISDTLVYATTSGILSKITLGAGLSLSSGTLSATATTPSLSSVLAVGNTSGANDIVMSTTRVIKSANGGGELGLDGGSYGTTGSVYLTNDNNGFGKSYLSFDDTLYGYKNFVSLTACDTSTNSLTGSINIGIYSSNVSAYKALLTLTSTISQIMFKTANISLIDAQINLNATTSIVSGILRMTANTASTLVYHDASKNLKSVTLGSGLSLVSGTLSATAPSLTGTAPIVYSAGNISITQSGISTNGYLSSTDWNLFNNKQAGLTGTGFVKSTAGVISYDTNTYLTTTAASTTYVPYTSATSDVDLGAWALNAGSIKVNGTNGNGHIHLKFQSANAPSQANSTTLFADTNGDIKWKNDGLFYTTLKSSLNTADRVYTLPNASGTVALTSDLTSIQTQIDDMMSAADLFNWYNFV